MFSKLKQFTELRSKAKTLQATLATERAEGSGGGKVKIVFDGTQRAISVTINPTVLTDAKTTEKCVKDAINDGMEKIQRLLSTKLQDTGGLELAKDVQRLMGK